MAKLHHPKLLYTGLRVRDMKRSIAFYTEALDMKMQFRFKIKETGGTVAYLVSPEGKHRVELNWYPGGLPFRKGDELDHLGFRVPDLKDTHAKLVAHGARVTIPTFREGEVLLTFYEDPDGIPIEIMSRKTGRFRVHARGRAGRPTARRKRPRAPARVQAQAPARRSRARGPRGA